MGEVSRRSGYMPLPGAASGRPVVINLVSRGGIARFFWLHFRGQKSDVSAAHVSFSWDTRT
jgi:hypothetical protein